MKYWLIFSTMILCNVSFGLSSQEFFNKLSEVDKVIELNKLEDKFKELMYQSFTRDSSSYLSFEQAQHKFAKAKQNDVFLIKDNDGILILGLVDSKNHIFIGQYFRNKIQSGPLLKMFLYKKKYYLTVFSIGQFPTENIIDSLKQRLDEEKYLIISRFSSIGSATIEHSIIYIKDNLLVCSSFKKNTKKNNENGYNYCLDNTKRGDLKLFYSKKILKNNIKIDLNADLSFIYKTEGLGRKIREIK